MSLDAADTRVRATRVWVACVYGSTEFVSSAPGQGP